MHSPRSRVLLLEDSAIEAETLLDYLASAFDVVHVTSVRDATARLAAEPFDVALVDLCVDDSRNLATFLACHAAAPHVPFVVQSGIGEPEVAIEAVARGAQDYLVKRNFSADLVRRSLRYAMERGRIERELLESRERYRLALAGANDGIWDWDLERGRFFVSERWEAMLGLPAGEFGGELEDWLALVHSADRDKLVAGLQAHVRGEQAGFDHEHRMLHADGAWRWVRTRGLGVRDVQGQVRRMAGSQSDISQRRVFEARLIHQATTDALTGLANRAAFLEHLESVVARCDAGTLRDCAVLFLDLDRFKVINDSLGHLVGDRLLVAVAQRLRMSVRPGDVVARLGGDEFALLVEGMDGPARADELAARVHRMMAQPFLLGNNQLFASVSIGIVHRAGQDDTSEDLLRNADIAMYRSKRAGRACTEVFSEVHHAAAAGRLDLENGLRRALAQGELFLNYQPIVRIPDQSLVGFEALVRWRAPDGHIIQPAEFIPIAEETGLIDAVGAWVMREACAQLVALPASLGLTVAVNVASRQFARPEFLAEVEACLRETGLPPHQLVLEITETALMENPVTVAELLHQLRERGVKIHLDDFGIGYSALGYLRRFPIDRLKIDRSFTQAIPGRPEDEAIILAILSLATSLGMEVVAEGVENEAQWLHLLGLHCAYGQGFYFSHPVDAARVVALAGGRQGAVREDPPRLLPRAALAGRGSQQRRVGDARPGH